MHISEHYINPSLHVRRKLIKIISTPQPNRVLINKLTHIRLIVPEEVVMQPGFFIIILILQSERLMRILINPLVLFQTSPKRILRSSKQQKLRAYCTHPTSGLEILYGLRFANYFNLDMYRMPFPIITIKFFYII